MMAYMSIVLDNNTICREGCGNVLHTLSKPTLFLKCFRSYTDEIFNSELFEANHQFYRHTILKRSKKEEPLWILLMPSAEIRKPKS